MQSDMKSHPCRVSIRAVLFCLAGAGMVSLSGCAAAMIGGAGAAGAGTVAYIRGDTEAIVEASLPEVKSATRQTIDELGLFMIDQQADRTLAAYTLRNAEDVKITIALEPLTSRTTKVRVRYGIWGDELQSGRLLSHITMRL